MNFNPASEYNQRTIYSIGERNKSELSDIQRRIEEAVKNRKFSIKYSNSSGEIMTEIYKYLTYYNFGVIYTRNDNDSDFTITIKWDNVK